MVKKTFILILMAIAYMIVMGHEVIPHEHFDDDFIKEHHHADNMNDDDHHHESQHLLFSHSYLIFHNSKEKEIVFVSSANDLKIDFISFIAFVSSHLFEIVPLDTSPPVFSDISHTIASAYIKSSGNRAPPAHTI